MLRYKKVKNEDGEYAIILCNHCLGTICQGYLRNGGTQWIITSTAFNLTNKGFPSLKEAKRYIEKRIVKRVMKKTPRNSINTATLQGSSRST